MGDARCSSHGRREADSSSKVPRHEGRPPSEIRFAGTYLEPGRRLPAQASLQAPDITPSFIQRLGGAEGDRTPDLRIANATLSQLSYGPINRNYWRR